MKLLIDDSSLPTDRAGITRWLDRRAAATARKTRLALRKIIGDALDNLPVLTASIDLSALDVISSQWLTVVADELLPDLGATYMAGSVTAWLGMPELKMAGNRAIDFATQWSNVVNDNAVSYMANASNRLVGVGQTTWRQVRSQVSNAIEKGLPNEALKQQIEQTRQWSEYRADTIARTETNAAYVQGDMAGGRALGNDGPVEKVWVAVMDDRTRESHVDAHEQVVAFDEMFDVGGNAMDSPLDPSAPPEEVVNCRCWVELLYEGDTRPDGSMVEADPSDTPDQLTVDDDNVDDFVMSPQVAEDTYNATDGDEATRAKAMFDRLGYSGLPKRASMSEVEALAADGPAGLVHRAFGDPQHASQFVNGDLFVGQGVLGSGTYAIEGTQAEFSAYVSRVLPNASAASDASLTMALGRDARVLDVGRKELEALGEAAGLTGPLAADPLASAAALGYDAVRYRRANETFMLILNRTKVVVAV